MAHRAVGSDRSSAAGRFRLGGNFRQPARFFSETSVLGRRLHHPGAHGARLPAAVHEPAVRRADLPPCPEPPSKAALPVGGAPRNPRPAATNSPAPSGSTAIRAGRGRSGADACALRRMPMPASRVLPPNPAPPRIPPLRRVRTRAGTRRTACRRRSPRRPTRAGRNCLILPFWNRKM